MSNSEHQSLEQFVNMPELLERVENDRELLAELFAMFQDDFPSLRDTLHEAVDAGDLSRLEKTAHTLKGMLANLSIEDGAEMGANLEAAARTGDWDKIRQAMAAFDREQAGLLAAVREFTAGREQ